MIHLIEDAKQMLRNSTALGLLRGAMWGSRADREGRMERLITWAAHRSSHEVVFDGGVILVTNRRLSDLPEVRALATRVPCIEVSVDDQEIAALMRRIAMEGFQRGEWKLEPDECMEVANYRIDQSARLNRTLDLRLLVNAFADRIQADDHDSGCCWRDLVFSSLVRRPAVLNDVEPVGIRQDRKARELRIAREIVELDPADRLKIWRTKTGKSQATLFRRLAELAKADTLDFEM